MGTIQNLQSEHFQKSSIECIVIIDLLLLFKI